MLVLSAFSIHFCFISMSDLLQYFFSIYLCTDTSNYIRYIKLKCFVKVWVFLYYHCKYVKYVYYFYWVDATVRPIFLNDVSYVIPRSIRNNSALNKIRDHRLERDASYDFWKHQWHPLTVHSIDFISFLQNFLIVLKI